jgi:hypothetical protein
MIRTFIPAAALRWATAVTLAGLGCATEPQVESPEVATVPARRHLVRASDLPVGFWAAGALHAAARVELATRLSGRVVRDLRARGRSDPSAAAAGSSRQPRHAGRRSPGAGDARRRRRRS